MKVSAGAAAASESERAKRKAEALRDQAARLETYAAKCEQGEAGEREVARTLDALSSAGFARIDDVRWPGTSRANLDHLVFGPAGFLVVDAKNWSGQVVVRRGVLRQGGYSRARETDKVARMAADLSAHLGPSVGSCRPVLCLVGQVEQPPTLCGSTIVIGLQKINRWLFESPVIWPASHVDALATWLPSVLESASSADPVKVLRERVHMAPPSRADLLCREPSARLSQPLGSARSSEGGLYGWLRR